MTRLLLLFLLAAAVPCQAQMRVDGSLFAQRFEARPVFGPGASLHFSFFDFATELVASGGYYIAPDDSADSWNVRIDARVNIPAGVLPLRPYVGVGMDRTTDLGTGRTSGVALAGAHLRLFSNRIIPFAEAWYRAHPALGDMRFRAGLRFQFRDDR